jgi:hypothetical protein
MRFYQLHGGIMENPIKKSQVHNTPESMGALMDYLEKFNGAEKAAAFTIMGMTWNLAHDVVQAAITEGE